MATWKESELEVLERYLQKHPGVISKADSVKIVQLLLSECSTVRSVAAVRKKISEVRSEQRTPNKVLGQRTKLRSNYTALKMQMVAAKWKKS